MRVVTIVGARPQFIKAAPLSLELRKEHEEFLVHTGQHYDDNMSEVFFRELRLPAPDVHLSVGSGSHGRQTAAMLAGIEDVLVVQRPDAMIVFGDTNSTLAGALAAAKLGIPIAHVEAGVRSFNRTMPEEINRVLTDRVATWLFAPSQAAVGHLAREGIVDGVHNVGDIMFDSLRLFAPRAAECSSVLERLRIQPKRYAVATVHRAANTDAPPRLRAIFQALAALELPVIVPLHPRTRAVLARHGIDLSATTATGTRRPASAQLVVIEPLGYLDMLQLQQHAAVILTDSGGIQKEAYYLRVPCITLREETEWPETVESGWNQIVSPCHPTAILRAVEAAGGTLGTGIPDYGNGNSAAKIVRSLIPPVVVQAMLNERGAELSER